MHGDTHLSLSLWEKLAMGLWDTAIGAGLGWCQWRRWSWGLLGTLGLVVAVSSAIAWALSTIADPEWNIRLNLFAALFAACSLGLVAPADKLCGWQAISLWCH